MDIKKNKKPKPVRPPKPGPGFTWMGKRWGWVQGSPPKTTTKKKK